MILFVAFTRLTSEHNEQFGRELYVKFFGWLVDPPLYKKFVKLMKDMEEMCQFKCCARLQLKCFEAFSVV